MEDIELAFPARESEESTETTPEKAASVDAPEKPAAEVKADEETDIFPEKDDEKSEEASEETNTEEVALSDDLKAYEKLLTSRKWTKQAVKEPAKLLPTLLKSYSEAESLIGQHGNTIKVEGDRGKALAALALGVPEDLNKFRERNGLDALVVQQPLATRKAESEALFGMINATLIAKTPEEQRVALDKLEEHFRKRNEDFAVEARTAKAPVDATRAFQARKTTALENFTTLKGENPKNEQLLNALEQLVVPDGKGPLGGILYRMGMDSLDIMATPERARGFLEIGKALHIAANLKDIVAQAVKKEIKRRGSARNASQSGSSAQRGSRSNSDSKVFDPTEVFE